jgi:hypothetical protein
MIKGDKIMKSTIFKAVIVAASLGIASAAFAGGPTIMSDTDMDKIVGGVLYDIYVNNGGQFAAIPADETPNGKWVIVEEDVDLDGLGGDYTAPFCDGCPTQGLSKQFDAASDDWEN